MSKVYTVEVGIEPSLINIFDNPTDAIRYAVNISKQDCCTDVREWDLTTPEHSEMIWTWHFYPLIAQAEYARTHAKT